MKDNEQSNKWNFLFKMSSSDNSLLYGNWSHEVFFIKNKQYKQSQDSKGLTVLLCLERNLNGQVNNLYLSRDVRKENHQTIVYDIRIKNGYL